MCFLECFAVVWTSYQQASFYAGSQGFAPYNPWLGAGQTGILMPQSFSPLPSPQVPFSPYQAQTQPMPVPYTPTPYVSGQPQPYSFYGQQPSGMSNDVAMMLSMLMANRGVGLQGSACGPMPNACAGQLQTPGQVMYANPNTGTVTGDAVPAAPQTIVPQTVAPSNPAAEAELQKVTAENDTLIAEQQKHLKDIDDKANKLKKKFMKGKKGKKARAQLDASIAKTKADIQKAMAVSTPPESASVEQKLDMASKRNTWLKAANKDLAKGAKKLDDAYKKAQKKAKKGLFVKIIAAVAAVVVSVVTFGAAAPAMGMLMAGVMAGAAAGATGGLINGMGTSLVNGDKLGTAVGNGLKGAAVGAVVGGVTGGLTQGMASAIAPAANSVGSAVGTTVGSVATPGVAAAARSFATNFVNMGAQGAVMGVGAGITDRASTAFGNGASFGSAMSQGFNASAMLGDAGTGFMTGGLVGGINAGITSMTAGRFNPMGSLMNTFGMPNAPGSAFNRDIFVPHGHGMAVAPGSSINPYLNANLWGEFRGTELGRNWFGPQRLGETIVMPAGPTYAAGLQPSGAMTYPLAPQAPMQITPQPVSAWGPVADQWGAINNRVGNLLAAAPVSHVPVASPVAPMLNAGGPVWSPTIPVGATDLPMFA